MGNTMAYRRSNGKGSRKMQPAVMQIGILVPAGESYVDLALCASIINRRGYKQECTSWAVGQFELFNSPGATGLVRIEKAPQSWVAQNAYTKSKALYDRMNDQVLDTEPDISGKWADFKIGLDSDHVLSEIQDSNNLGGTILTPVITAGGASVFTQADFNGAVAPIADWDFSILEIPNDPTSGTTTGYTMHLVGPDVATSKSLIEGYARSRARPRQNDPNVPITEGWMNELFDVGEQLEEIRDNLDQHNDRPPYALADGSVQEFYPGGGQEFPGLQTHSFCNFSATTVSGKNTIMGGVFDYGLMKLTNETDSPVSMIIHMLPGSHRGYMVEMI